MNGGFVSYLFLFKEFIFLLKITIFLLRREDPKIFMMSFFYLKKVCFGWGNYFFMMLLSFNLLNFL
jgi:hypothetical protein